MDHCRCIYKDHLLPKFELYLTQILGSPKYLRLCNKKETIFTVNVTVFNIELPKMIWFQNFAIGAELTLSVILLSAPVQQESVLLANPINTLFISDDIVIAPDVGAKLFVLVSLRNPYIFAD